MLIRAFRKCDEDAVVALWQACGLTRPWNDHQEALGFYKSIGYLQDEAVSLGKRLIADR